MVDRCPMNPCKARHMGYALRNLIRALAANKYHDEFDGTAPVLHWPNSIAKDILDILETEQLVECTPVFSLFDELANHKRYARTMIGSRLFCPLQFCPAKRPKSTVSSFSMCFIRLRACHACAKSSTKRFDEANGGDILHRPDLGDLDLR